MRSHAQTHTWTLVFFCFSGNILQHDLHVRSQRLRPNRWPLAAPGTSSWRRVVTSGGSRQGGGRLGAGDWCDESSCTDSACGVPLTQDMCTGHDWLFFPKTIAEDGSHHQICVFAGPGVTFLLICCSSSISWWGHRVVFRALLVGLGNFLYQILGVDGKVGNARRHRYSGVSLFQLFFF